MLLRNVRHEHDMQKERFIRRIQRYSNERFHLGQFVPLSLIISGVLTIGTQRFLDIPLQLHSLLRFQSILLTAGALFFFLLRLRIFDEFKDFDHDLQHYAQRPVPRGLVSKRELGFVLIPIVISEFTIAILSGYSGMILFIISFIYSLLMYREFFISEWIKDHFTIYIISHEVLLFPLFFYLCAINGFGLHNFENLYFWLLVACVGSYMFLLEVARKVRPKDSEIASRDTYTAQYGVRGASWLLLTISVVSVICLLTFTELIYAYSPVFSIVTLICLGAFASRLWKFDRKPTTTTSKQVFVAAIIFVFVSCIGSMLVLI